MRHQKKTIKLGREAGPRKALMRSLTESLILHGGITTTIAKAKALRTVVEPLVTKAKHGKPADLEKISSALYTSEAKKVLLKEIGPRYLDRRGGYTRIIKLGNRFNDSAEMVRIEFV